VPDAAPSSATNNPALPEAVPAQGQSSSNAAAAALPTQAQASQSTEKASIELSQDARKLFAAVKHPSKGPAKSIGTANCGCIAGAVPLALDGPYWQVMRPSRNRYYGHPSMIKYIKDLSERANKLGWNGLLIGDINMPRGGPMPSGHASHQRGTDVDIWLTPAPDHKLSSEARETLEAGSVLKVDTADLDPAIWTTKHANFVKAAAQDDNVARIFVTPSIKKYMCNCKDPAGADTAWLRRLRPWEGHDDHIHVRLKCPPGDPCVEQDPPPEGDGCGDELAEYYKKVAADPPFKSIPVPEQEENKPVPLNSMPAECGDLLKK
jgi:penicillin-insensitive murein endopeptidase